MKNDHTIRLRARFGGIKRFDADASPCLIFNFQSEGLSGRIRDLSSTVEIRNPNDVTRFEREFKIGDEIELTIETDEDHPSLPTTLLACTHVAAPAAA